MDPVQLILIVFGVALGVGGVLWLFRSAGRGDDARGGYLPLAMVIVGLVIAYRSYSSFTTLDTQDIAIMFLFVVGLLGLLSLQFFVVDKNRHNLDATGEGGAGSHEGEDS